MLYDNGQNFNQNRNRRDFFIWIFLQWFNQVWAHQGVSIPIKINQNNNSTCRDCGCCEVPGIPEAAAAELLLPVTSPNKSPSKRPPASNKSIVYFITISSSRLQTVFYTYSLPHNHKWAENFYKYLRPKSGTSAIFPPKPSSICVGAGSIRRDTAPRASTPPKDPTVSFPPNSREEPSANSKLLCNRTVFSHFRYK